MNEALNQEGNPETKADSAKSYLILQFDPSGRVISKTPIQVSPSRRFLALGEDENTVERAFQTVCECATGLCNGLVELGQVCIMDPDGQAYAPVQSGEGVIWEPIALELEEPLL